MPETVGVLILAGAGELGAPIGVAAGAFTFGSTGISLATVVGTGAILAASIGLQYALARPNVPKPEDGSQAVKQAIPPRVRGYGLNRLSGYYVLFEAAGPPPANSYDVIAFHSGRIAGVEAMYLHDDPITTAPSALSEGVIGAVRTPYSDGRYTGWCYIQVLFGRATQPPLSLLTDSPDIAAVWTAAHAGKGIACAGLKCTCPADVARFTKIYPHGHPELSLVANCSPVWDPRDPAQSRSDETSWRISYNPVVQLIDYLTRADGGMGLDYERMIAPNILAWLVEIGLCDEQVATARPGITEARYRSHGWFYFDNKPEDVIGNLLSTCDGWLAEAGDGTLQVTVGVYREPAEPPLTEKHIFDFALNYGHADEQSINRLDISYTDPASNYVTVQLEPWDDEEAIAQAGTIRSQSLDLKWVQSYSQARRLADRAMQRVNAGMTGSFTTSLYGLRYLGRRWVKVQYPFVSGLQDCVVEIQDAEIDLMAGRISWNFIRIGDDIEAYDPATDEGSVPVLPDLVPARLGLDFSEPANSQYLILLEDI